MASIYRLFMPPAVRNLFEKRFLNFQKRLIRGKNLDNNSIILGRPIRYKTFLRGWIANANLPLILVAGFSFELGVNCATTTAAGFSLLIFGKMKRENKKSHRHQRK